MRLHEPNRADLWRSSWLADVCKASQPIDIGHPIWVRSKLIQAGPTIPPERHPNCEFCFIEQGGGIALVGREEVKRAEGDLLIYGPGVPHWFQITEYPFKFIAVHFLPGILFELAPESDAAKILNRFTARLSLARRSVRPPPPLREFFRQQFNDLNAEFENRRFGWEAKMRSDLVEMLVELMRYEERKCSNDFEKLETQIEGDWIPLEKALQFLRQHVSEPIYARDVSRAAGVSESRLKVLFREVMGTSWSHYLQGYRIHLAAAKVCEPGHNILEVALEVGFENPSHFSTTFRSLMGISPNQYAKRAAIKSM